jgi:hypothetical protein
MLRPIPKKSMAFNGYCGGGETKNIWGVSKMEHPLHELYI